MSEPDPSKPTILVATSNPGKVIELGSLLVLRGFHVVGPRDLAEGRVSFGEGPAEDGKNFEENVRVKARFYAEAFNRPTLADDSGLCVAALGGAPGVRSARYGGADLDDLGRCHKLLSELAGETDRRAWFITVLALARPGEERELVWEGRLYGEMSLVPLGDSGFGYDPIFRPNGSKLTLAQMSAEDKNLISHRAMAVKKMEADLDEIASFSAPNGPFVSSRLLKA